MDFSQLNRNKFNKIDWGIDTECFTFCKLSDLYKNKIDKKHLVKGVFFMRSKFGLQVVVILPDEKKLVTLPTTENDMFSGLLENKDFVDSVKSKGFLFEVRKYKSKTYNKDCYSVNYYNKEQEQELY